MSERCDAVENRISPLEKASTALVGQSKGELGVLLLRDRLRFLNYSFQRMSQ